MKLILIFLVSVLSLIGCRPPDGCASRSTRCVGNVAEVCDADQYFHELMDCDQVSAQSRERFVCGYVEEGTADGVVRGHTCLPARSSNGGAGGGAGGGQ